MVMRRFFKLKKRFLVDHENQMFDIGYQIAGGGDRVGVRRRMRHGDDFD